MMTINTQVISFIEVSLQFTMNRIKTVEYSDLLINKIDLKVEQFIADCHHLPNGQEYIDELNSQREKWIAEIRECEEFNLTECGDNKEKIEESELFKRFCFLFEWPGNVLETTQFTWRLISTDKWLSEKQIDCFSLILSQMTYYLNLLTFDDVSKLFINVKPGKNKVNLK